MALRAPHTRRTHTTLLPLFSPRGGSPGLEFLVPFRQRNGAAAGRHSTPHPARAGEERRGLGRVSRVSLLTRFMAPLSYITESRRPLNSFTLNFAERPRATTLRTTALRPAVVMSGYGYSEDGSESPAPTDAEQFEALLGTLRQMTVKLNAHTIAQHGLLGQVMALCDDVQGRRNRTSVAAPAALLPPHDLAGLLIDEVGRMLGEGHPRSTLRKTWQTAASLAQVSVAWRLTIMHWRRELAYLRVCNEAEVAIALTECGSLRRLGLGGCPGSFKSSPTFAVGCLAPLQHLEELYIDQDLPWAKVLKGVHLLPKLRVLTFKGDLPDQAMPRLVKCEHLEVLDLHLKDLSDVGIATLVQCRSLREIDLSYLDITDCSLRALATLPRLRALNVEYCVRISDCGLQHLAEAHQLEELNVARSNDGITSVGLQALAQLHALKVLVLSSQYRRQGDSAAACDDAAILAIAAGCTHLEEIFLSWSSITTLGLQALTHHCKQLRRLDIYKTCLADSAAPLLATLPRLHALRCCAFTHEGLASIAQCSALAQLDVSSCKLDHAALCHLANGCPQLIELEYGEMAATRSRAFDCADVQAMAARGLVNSKGGRNYQHVFISARAQKLREEAILANDGRIHCVEGEGIFKYRLSSA